jgi:O-acetyl-ADP-ribose deacetylase (regulator of RNase III)
VKQIDLVFSAICHLLLPMSNLAARLTFANGKTLELHGPADITKETTEAIVNAANSYLLGGGGVDGAIHDAGGPSILQECKRIVAKIGTLPAGKAVITTAGRLAAKYVIHTVGPVYYGGRQREAETLASCYRESLRIADDHGIRSLAFPSISTGAFGYPVPEATEIAVRTIVEILPPCADLEHVRFVLFDIATCEAYVQAAEKISRESLEISVIFTKGPS